MAEISMSTEVDAPPDEVWATLSDPSKTGEWLVTHVDYPDGPPEYAEGAEFKEKVTIMGMPGEVVWKIAELVPGSSLKMEGTGPMGVMLKASYAVEGDGDSSQITFNTGFEGAAIAAMAAPLENASKQALQQSLDKFKTLVG